MSFVLGLFKGAWGYVAAGLAALLAILAALSRVKKSGRDEVIAKAAEKELDNVTTANKVNAEVQRATGSDVDKRLRDRWSRD